MTPPPDMMQSLRDERDALAERVRVLEALLYEVDWVPPHWALTTSEASMLNLLTVRRGTVSDDHMFDVLYGDRPECDQPSIKMIKIKVCLLRKKLARLPVPVRIKTMTRGYCLDDATRLLLSQMMQVA